VVAGRNELREMAHRELAGPRFELQALE